MLTYFCIQDVPDTLPQWYNMVYGYGSEEPNLVDDTFIFKNGYSTCLSFPCN